MRETKLQLSSVQGGNLLTHRIQGRVEKIHHKQRADAIELQEKMDLGARVLPILSPGLPTLLVSSESSSLSLSTAKLSPQGAKEKYQ